MKTKKLFTVKFSYDVVHPISGTESMKVVASTAEKAVEKIQKYFAPYPGVKIKILSPIEDSNFVLI